MSAASDHRTVRDDRAASANYIAALTAELAGIAKRHGLETLAYILQMATLEADTSRARAALVPSRRSPAKGWSLSLMTRARGRGVRDDLRVPVPAARYERLRVYRRRNAPDHRF